MALELVTSGNGPLARLLIRPSRGMRCAPTCASVATGLVQYFTTDAAFATINQQVGYAPLRTTLADDPQYLPMGSQAQALAQPNLDQLTRLVAWQDYPGANYAQVEQLLEDTVTKIAFQGQPAATALTAAQNQAKSLLGP